MCKNKSTRVKYKYLKLYINVVLVWVGPRGGDHAGSTPTSTLHSPVPLNPESQACWLFIHQTKTHLNSCFYTVKPPNKTQMCVLVSAD